MKKFVFLMLLLASIGKTGAQEKIVVNDVMIEQGGQANLIIGMELQADHDYVSYQFTVELPEGISLIADKYGNAACTLASNQPTQVFKVDFLASNGIFKCYSSPSVVIEAYEGTLVTIPVVADASLAIGTRLTGKLSGIVFSHINSTAEYFADATFTIEVVEQMTVLDEESTIMPDATEGVNVRVQRTINAGKWSTICLPFAMTGEQATSVFGDDAELADFNGYEIEENDDGDVVGIQVKFTDLDITDGIEANHPYIIKVTKSVSEFVVRNVDLEPEDEPVVAAVKRTRKQWSELIGTYVADTTVPDNCLFLSDNKFWYSAGRTKMKAYRAYFDFYDVLTGVENAASRISMSFEGKSTIVDAVQSYGEDDGLLYDLQGRPVKKPEKGLYIKNGGKITVR